MIDPKDFGASRPKLDPDVVKGDVGIFTIQDVGTPTVNRDGKDVRAMVLTFREFPDNAYWPNPTGIKALVEVLGPDETKWIGKRVPLEKAKTTNPQSHERVTVLWVAGPKEWDGYLKKARR